MVCGSTGTVLRATYPPVIYPQTGKFACPICGEQITYYTKSSHDITSATHIGVLQTMRDAQLAAPKPPIVFMSLEEFNLLHSPKSPIDDSNELNSERLR
jgi:hypothetical protein